MNNNSKNLVRSSMLLAIIIVIQIIGRNVPQFSQVFVGPIVNMILLLAFMMCGLWYGIGISVLTPLFAWMTGQLPAPMLPFVPFIITGNVIYVLVFALLFNRGKYGKFLGLGAGSLLKFLFLWLSASKLIHLLSIGVPKKVASKLVVMMGVPQLVTALIGGAAALVLYELLRRRGFSFKSAS